MFSSIKNKIKVYLYNLIKSHEADLINTKLHSAFSTIGSGFALGEYFSFNATGDQYILNIEDNVTFRKYCHLMIQPKAKLHIHKGVFFNNYCSVNCLGEITIGEHTLFGEGVKIYDHNHRYNYAGEQLNVERNEFKIGSISIGKNCWIGSNVTILNNVKIGDNVIIGANCLIYKSVTSNSVIKAKTEYI